MMKEDNPWMGLNSYKEPSEESNSYKFCGRQRETFDLVQLIEHNTFVTLYGSTGVGKTSLLRAGVFPVLRHHEDYTIPNESEKPKFYPFYIRLGSVSQLEDQKENNKPLYEELIKNIEIKLTAIETKSEKPRTQEEPITPEEKELEYLWLYFHTHQFTTKDQEGKDRVVTPVLVLDQFEELFTNRVNEEKATLFLKQLYVLIENHKPWSTEEFNYPYCRFVISIRDDRFFYLEDVIERERLNLFKENRYRLRAMEDENAKAVVTIPGRGVIEETDKDAIAEAIIGKAKDADRGEINTLMLSLICHQLYNKVKNNKEKTITLEDAQSINMTLGSFYAEALMGIPAHEKKYLESKFIYEDQRQPVKEDEFKKEAPIAYERLYHEPDSKYKIITTVVVPGNNVPHVELIHDQIASVMNAKKKSQQSRRRAMCLRLLLVASVLLLGLGLLLFGGVTSNKYKQNFALTRIDDHKFTSRDYDFIGPFGLEDNAMVEDFALIGDFALIDKSEYTISRCHYLKSLDLRNIGVIGRDTLFLKISDCERLEQIKLPNSLSALELTIDSCPKLLLQINKGLGFLYIKPMQDAITIQIDSDVDRYAMVDGVLWDLEERRIAYCPGIGKSNAPRKIVCTFPSEIKDDVRIYGNTTFYNGGFHHDESLGVLSTIFVPSQSQLNSLSAQGYQPGDGFDNVVFKYSLDSIPSSLFKDHIHVREVQMPKSLKEIHDEAFMRCIGLKTIDLPDDLEYIGKGAFMGCTKLTHIMIPASVKRIEEQAFEGCSSLEIVTFAGDSIELGNRAFANCQKIKIVRCPKMAFESNHEYESPFYNCPNMEYIKSKGYQLAAKNNVSRKDYDIFMTSSGIFINPKQNVTEIFLPLEQEFGEFEFGPNIKSITDIHVPWPQPYSYVDEKEKSLFLYIDSIERQHITLHVPFGCKRYYSHDSHFVGYKDIIEDTPIQWIKNWSQYLLNQTWDMIRKHFVSLLILLFLFIAWIAYPLLSKNDFFKRRMAIYRQSGIRIFLAIVVYAVLSFLCCLILYWIFNVLCQTNVYASQFFALVVTLSLVTLYLMAPAFFDSRKDHQDTLKLKDIFRNGVNSFKNLIRQFIRNSKKYVIGAMSIILAIILLHFVPKLSNRNQDHREVLLSYIDSLVQSNTVSENDIQQLGRHLAMCGDSLSLIHTKSIPYDNCDPNYEMPFVLHDSISMIQGDTIFKFDSERMVKYPLAQETIKAPDNSVININEPKYSGDFLSVDSHAGVIKNKSTGQDYPLPYKYRDLYSYSWGSLNGRYFYLNNSFNDYDEIAIFDMQENGNLIVELKGDEISKIDKPVASSQNEICFFTTSSDSVSFYYINNGAVFLLTKIKNKKSFYSNQQCKNLGYYLIVEEDSIDRKDPQKELIKVRYVMSTKYPYAKPVVYVNKPIFASNDEIIIVNSRNKTFDFYRFETLSDLIRRSHSIDEQRRNEMINLLKKQHLNK